MCIKIRDEDREIIQKLQLALRHAQVDFEYSAPALFGSFKEAMDKDNIDLMVDPWNRYQEAKKKLRDQETGLQNFLKEKYPETRKGKWEVDQLNWVLHPFAASIFDKMLFASQTAELNRQAAKLHPSPAASGAAPAAA